MGQEATACQHGDYDEGRRWGGESFLWKLPVEGEGLRGKPLTGRVWASGAGGNGGQAGDEGVGAGGAGEGRMLGSHESHWDTASSGEEWEDLALAAAWETWGDPLPQEPASP